MNKQNYILYKIIFSILLILNVNTLAFTQIPTKDSTDIKTNNTDSSKVSTTQTDTIKTAFIPKDSATFSMNEFLFGINDTIIVEKWKYNTDYHNFSFTTYDSTLQEFHINNPIYKNSISNTYLGNIGLAVKSNIFFQPNPENEYLFIRAFSPYLFNAKNTEYYNVRKPFTLFRYQAGPKEEQSINIMHTQNVNRFFNGFVKFNSYSSKGFYTRQQTKNNSGIFGGSFIRKRFESHINYTFSKVNVNENGGIVDPLFITDTILSPAGIMTKLNNGNNFIKERQLFIDQKIGFLRVRDNDTTSNGSYMFSFQYNYFRQKDVRIYEDEDQLYENSITNEKLLMYKNNYALANTFDTSSYTINNHLFRFNMEEVAGNPLSFGLYGGIGISNTKYTYYNKDTIFINSLNTKKHSNFVEAGIFRLKKDSWLNFRGYVRYFTNGYRQNDFSIYGMIRLSIGKGLFKSVFTAHAKSENKTPNYFINKYYSNHYRWNNNFKAENRSQLSVNYALPNLYTTIGANYSLISNYIYFNDLAIPSQNTSTFNVLDVHLNNKVEVANFHLITKAVFQETSKPELIDLPKLSCYNALYYENEIHFETTNGTIKLQLGADVRFWTKFYAPDYSPATSQFYTQHDFKTGNYPFVGAFLNLEIKRMRIYIKSEHINESFMRKQKHTNYFLAPNYPAPPTAIRYGIAWTFYD